MAPRLTRGVLFLLISCVAVFLIQQSADRFFGAQILRSLALVPADVVMKLQVWKLFTYVFVHGDITHLVLNMLLLVFLGADLESSWGTRRFLQYFFFCSTFAGVMYLLLQVFMSGDSIYQPMVGASGGLYGVLLGYGLLFGERAMLFMMLFPMKAKHFVWILAAIEFFTMLFSDRQSALSSVAHIGGMVAGVLYLKVWVVFRLREKLMMGQKSLFQRKKAREAGRHLKLVIDNEKNFGKDKSDTGSDPKTWH